MINRIALLAALTLSISTPSFAGGPGDVLNTSFAGLTSTVENPSIMRSKTRTSFSGGRLRAYAKVTRLSVFDFSPPSFSAGCGGVSLHFGGLSFANGEQYKQLVESIIQNSPGLLIQLAITTACEPCGTALKDIQKITDLARKAASDSCEAANHLLGTAAGMTDLCENMSSLVSKIGEETDQAAAKERCSSRTAQYDLVEKAKNFDLDGNSQTTEPETFCNVGEKTWCALSSIDLVPSSKVTDASGKEIFAPLGIGSLDDSQLHRRAFGELLYYQIEVEKGPTDSNASNTVVLSSGDDKAGGESIALAYKCGRGPGTAPSSLTSAQERVRETILDEECKGFWDKILTLKISVLTEEMEVGDPEFRLKTPDFEPVTLSSWMADRSFNEVGLLPKVLDALLEAHSSALARTSLGVQQLSIIQNAPLPLIQLLNLSHSYPERALELIAESAVVITKMIVRTNVLDAVKAQTTNLVMSRVKKQQQDAITKGISNFIEGAKIAVDKDETDKARMFIMEFVHAGQTLLSQEISKSTLNNNLLFQQKFIFDPLKNPKNNTD